MERKHLIKSLIASLSMILISGCFSTTEKEIELDPAVANDLRIIKESYNPPSCLSASFGVRIRSGGETRKADGKMMADTGNDQMHILLTDPYFGMQVSEVIVSNGRVYVKNAGEDARVLPLGDFELSGVGNNSIYLPFALFQDLMFGRIPSTVFSRRNLHEKRDGTLQVVVSDNVEKYEYEFRSNRLVSLSYLKSDSFDRIEAKFRGSLPDTVFPRTMELKGGKGENLRDEMQISFREIAGKDRCPLGEFRFP